MTLTVSLFYLLCGFALLGSLDIGYFHIYRFKLYRMASSRGEHLTHLLRTGLFLVALLWVMCVEAQGLFSLGLPLVLLADFINSMVDVLLEPKSRRLLGGLPPGEYAVHMVTMFLSGIILAVAVMDCLNRLNTPPQLRLEWLDVPAIWLVLGWQIVVVTLGFLIFEGLGLLRSMGTRATHPSTLSSE